MPVCSHVLSAAALRADQCTLSCVAGPAGGVQQDGALAAVQAVGQLLEQPVRPAAPGASTAVSQQQKRTGSTLQPAPASPAARKGSHSSVSKRTASTTLARQQPGQSAGRRALLQQQLYQQLQVAAVAVKIEVLKGVVDQQNAYPIREHTVAVPGRSSAWPQ
jgi:hypothetical protein